LKTSPKKKKFYIHPNKEKIINLITDLFYSLAAALCLGLLIYFFQSNTQGFNVFRYIQF